MAKFLSHEETLEILKEYDPDYYEYITRNAWNFGIHTRMYAESLKAKHKQSQIGGAQDADRQV